VWRAALCPDVCLGESESGLDPVVEIVGLDFGLSAELIGGQFPGGRWMGVAYTLEDQVEWGSVGGAVC